MTQPAGWYHAEGDPPGTQRYWDGSQWQGGPQPASTGGAGAPGVAGFATSVGGANAAAGKRFVAFLIDAGIGVGLYVVGAILIAILGSISDALGALMSLVLVLAYIGYYVYNLIYLQGTTGQTIGKKQQGIRLVGENGQPVGMVMAFVRGIVQGVFAIPCYLDHWWILVDDDNRRLSDKVLNMNVLDA